MAMMADGYGFAAYPSATVVFSNILYGYALAALPQVGDISRYALLSITLNIVAIVFICRALLLLAHSRTAALAVSTLSGLLPLAFPQFTILAGMLSVAGLLQVAVYLRRSSIYDLVVAGALLFVAILIRSHECYLVLLLYGPFLLTRNALLSRPLWSLVVALAVVTLGATVADWAYYQRPEWGPFRELNLLRAPFTDFGLVPYIDQHPELLEGTNYSRNDLALLGIWWLIDPFGSDPKGLALLLSRIDLSSFVSTNLQNARGALASLAEPPLRYLIAPALLAVMFSGSWMRLGIAWLALIGMVVVFGFLGRPPVTRVYYGPVVLLLCLATLDVSRALPRWALISSLGLMIVAAATNYAQRNAVSTREYAVAAAEMAALDKAKVYVVWGATLRLESMYPVFVSMKAVRSLRLYGLGVTSLAPFAMAHWADRPGGLPGRLVNGPPVPFFAHRGEIDRLATYCDERLSARLRVVEARQLAIGPLAAVTCQPGGPTREPT
jgi:hypothetical protein